jgi:hypothetical protein
MLCTYHVVLHQRRLTHQLLRLLGKVQQLFNPIGSHRLPYGLVLDDHESDSGLSCTYACCSENWLPLSRKPIERPIHLVHGPPASSLPLKQKRVAPPKFL